MLIFWREKLQKLTYFVEQVDEIIIINTVEFQKI